MSVAKLKQFIAKLTKAGIEVSLDFEGRLKLQKLVYLAQKMGIREVSTILPDELLKWICMGWSDE